MICSCETVTSADQFLHWITFLRFHLICSCYSHLEQINLFGARYFPREKFFERHTHMYKLLASRNGKRVQKWFSLFKFHFCFSLRKKNSPEADRNLMCSSNFLRIARKKISCFSDSTKNGVFTMMSNRSQPSNYIQHSKR